MEKRGQVTVFIIVGIVILLAASIIIYITRGSDLKEFTPVAVNDLPTEIAPIQLYMDSCIERELKAGLRLIGAHGGYVGMHTQDEIYTGKTFDVDLAGIDPTSFGALTVNPNDQNSNVAYWFYMKPPNNCDDIGAPCVFEYQIPPLRKEDKFSGDPNSIEEQLAEYIKKNIAKCSAGFSVFEAQGINITAAGAIAVRVIIAKDDTKAYVEYPFDINSELLGKSNLDKFYARAKVKLPKMYELAKNITYMQVENNFIEQIMLETTTIYAGLDSEIPPYGEEEMGASERSWPMVQAKNRLSEIYANYLSSLKVENTLGYTIPSSFPNDWEESFYYHYQVLPVIGDYKDIEADFMYSSNWPLYASFNRGKDIIRSTRKLSILGMYTIYDYDTTYDISVPLLVELKDRDSDVSRDGTFTFNIALEGNVRNNEIIKNAIIYPPAAGNVSPWGEPMICYPNQRTSALMTIFVSDTSGVPISDALINYKSGSQNCGIGQTTIINNRGILRDRFPQGYGLIKVVKEGYLTELVPVFFGEDSKIVNITMKKMFDVKASAQTYKIKKKSTIGFGGMIEINEDEYAISTENLTESEIDDLSASSWFFSIESPYILRSSENYTDRVTVILTRLKDNDYDSDFVTAFKATGDEISKIRLVEGRYNITYIVDSKIPEFIIPKKRACTMKLAGVCTQRSTLYEDTPFGGDKPYFAGSTTLENVYMPIQSNPDTLIVFYGMYFDWPSVPQADRVMNDYSALEDFGFYAREYKNYLLPKVAVTR